VVSVLCDIEASPPVVVLGYLVEELSATYDEDGVGEGSVLPGRRVGSIFCCSVMLCSPLSTSVTHWIEHSFPDPSNDC